MKNDENAYKKFLNDLVLEVLYFSYIKALIQLRNEKNVNVYCREDDQKYLENQASKISEIFKKKTGIDCKINVMKEKYLPKDGYFI
jgi:hypothetical protein